MTVKAEINGLQTFVDRELSSKQALCVLEAGCGSASRVNFGTRARMVGIDISEKQLDRNSELNEKVLGDIQYYQFPSGAFDAIICWDVLEHLPRPELAMERFSDSLKPGGLIILKLPNVLSVKGLVTKFLPHWFHVLVYRYFYGDKNAGKDDNLPFKTYLRFRISAKALQSQGAQLGLQSTYFSTFDVANINWLQRKKAVHFAYTVVKRVVGFFSFGRIGDSELILVLRK